ncbi:penicillin-binding protein 1C [Mangrovibrevibacter kandeliae]|uniref:penicillin-binding protein 1C n=1 Tax=Mangrovibrevibacter kandeliae TaxID=2968473 RepID=UPI003558D519
MSASSAPAAEPKPALTGLGPRRLRRLFAAALVLVCAAVLCGAVLFGLNAAIEARVGVVPEPEVATVVDDRDGHLLRAFASADGRWRLDVQRSEVDPRFLQMLLAWEDRRFWTHGGVDGRALVRAAWQALTHGHIVSGGSTLTMQVARMLRGSPNDSLADKADQILDAVALERTLPKTAIVDLYLKIAPYGGNLEGVRAAALAWFGKEPKRLTAAEAALLVVLPQSPERFRPDRFPARAKTARDRVLTRMQHLGLLAAPEAERARAEPVPRRRRELPMLAAHAAQRLVDAAPTRKRFRLTVDAGLQQRLEDYAREKATHLGEHVSLALLVADHATGAILASVGSPDLFDAERQGHVDLTEALRSPGSTLKPLIYGLAFERGVAHPESLVDDRPADFAGYTPQNFDHVYEGVITARRALQLSRNLPAVELLSAVGPSRLVQRMRRAGAHPELGNRSLPGLAIGLGGLGLSLHDLVGIYAAIANEGRAVPLRIDADAAPDKPKALRVLSPQAAWYVSSILSGATATVKGSPGEVAYKTGTSYGYRDAWTIGFDGQHVVGVWLGRPDGATVPGLVGQDSAVPVMRDVFARLGPLTRLPGPPPGILAAAGDGLPPPLRRIGAAAALKRGGLVPEITFPIDASRVELGLDSGAPSDLFLKVRNGRPPFTWYVDGAPVARNELRHQAVWHPIEPGFVTISVVDATGAASRSRVFLQ